LIGSLNIDMYIPALPQLSVDLNASASSIQLSLTACLVGLGIGQLVIGPLSDRVGRRRPLFCGLVVFIVSSFMCAIAPNALALVVLRFLEGFGGSAGIVIGRAAVRDLYSGRQAARFFSFLMLVIGAGPVFAPQVGAELLRVMSWRGLFVFLGVAGFLLLVVAALLLPETLTPSRRELGGYRVMVASMWGVLASRVFLANALTCAFGLGAIFAYIAGSSFAIEDIYHLSPQAFSLIFTLNGCAVILGARVNASLLSRVGSERLLLVAVGVMAISGTVLVLVVLGGIGLAGILPCFFVTLFCGGFVSPNATALAMNDFPDAAGSASALLGVLQFAIGAAVAPLVGLAGNQNALPMAIAMSSCGILALIIRFAMLRGVTRSLPAGVEHVAV
jgi:DHA1 family bicyclomycin/chloramphenicol resistance-like MFS transporter